MSSNHRLRVAAGIVRTCAAGTCWVILAGLLLVSDPASAAELKMNSNNRPVIEGAEPAITSLNTNSSINGTQVINGMPVLISVTNSVSSAFTFFEKKLSSLVGEYVVARK